MKYLLCIIISLVVAVSVYFGFFSAAKERSINNQPGGTAQNRWETKIDERPPVTVTATPAELGKNVGVWKFDIVFDTHSGSLDDDPLRVTRLIDDKGNTYEPTAWEGPGPGGHHRAGILVFKAINPVPPYVELNVKNIGGVSARSFKWDLE